MGLIYVTNFFNFLLKNKNKLIYGIGGILALIKILEYYSIVDFTAYSEQFFYLFYSQPYATAFTCWRIFSVSSSVRVPPSSYSAGLSSLSVSYGAALDSD